MTRVASELEELAAVAGQLLKQATANRSWTMEDEVFHIKIHGKRSVWGQAQWDYWGQRWADLHNRPQTRLRDLRIKFVEEKIKLLEVRYALDD